MNLTEYTDAVTRLLFDEEHQSWWRIEQMEELVEKIFLYGQLTAKKEIRDYIERTYSDDLDVLEKLQNGDN